MALNENQVDVCPNPGNGYFKDESAFEERQENLPQNIYIQIPEAVSDNEAAFFC